MYKNLQDKGEIMSKYWQIAAGTTARDYSELFIDHNLMFLGDGQYGDYNENEKLYECMEEHEVKRFVKEVKEGHIIVLRVGAKIIDVGIIDENCYKWNPKFDDVMGWTLQHTRKVSWGGFSNYFDQLQQKPDKHFFYKKRYNRFSEIDINKFPIELKQKIDKIKLHKPKLEDNSIQEIKAGDILTLEQVGEKLFAKGLSNESIEKLIKLIEKQKRLSKWYEKFGEDSMRPTEHEVVAHMILPMLIALGWSEQLLAIEWNKIDIAAFNRTPTTHDTCVMICEAKGIGNALQEEVYEQAIEYVQGKRPEKTGIELKNCKKILLAEGSRIYLYEKNGNEWSKNPTGYINFMKMREEHIAPKGTNAIKTIMKLTPFGIV